MDTTAKPENAEQPAEVPVARFITTKLREAFVDLDYPFEFNGVLYEKIKVRRISAQEMSDWEKGLEIGGNPVPPVVECTPEIWGAMDADDQQKVEEKALDFFPQRLKMMRDIVMAASSRAIAGGTSDTSQEPSAPESTSS